MNQFLKTDENTLCIVVQTAKLPNWIKKYVPSPRNSLMIEFNEAEGSYDVYTPMDENGERELLKSFETITAAYDFGNTYVGDGVKAEINNRDNVSLVSMDDGNSNIKKINEKYSNFLFVNEEGQVNSRALSFTCDGVRIANLERAYANWLEVSEAYAANPESFYHAYEFVNQHPIFWSCEAHEGYVSVASWVTDCGMRDAYIEPYFDYEALDDNGVPAMTWVIEHGPTYKYGSHNHTHDYRLDVSEDTIETAYIEFAKRIAFHYHNDGLGIEAHMDLDYDEVHAEK